MEADLLAESHIPYVPIYFAFEETDMAQMYENLRYAADTTDSSNIFRRMIPTSWYLIFNTSTADCLQHFHTNYSDVGYDRKDNRAALGERLGADRHSRSTPLQHHRKQFILCFENMQWHERETRTRDLFSVPTRLRGTCHVNK